MYPVWKKLGTLGFYVDNESIPLKIIFISVLKSFEFWHLCKSLLPSAKGLSFTFMQESVVFLLIPTYSLVGKHRVLGKDLSIYGHSNIFDHELLLLTIIYMISELGGEKLSPYLSLCSMDAIGSKNMLWVVVIMKDYMIVEYAEFAKSKLWHRPFLKIRWIAIVWWLRALLVSFQESLWSIL